MTTAPTDIEAIEKLIAWMDENDSSSVRRYPETITALQSLLAEVKALRQQVATHKVAIKTLLGDLAGVDPTFFDTRYPGVHLGRAALKDQSHG